MANLLYLVHRLPYPPNKGDKVRSYHLLQHLAARHRVFLGTFLDDPADAPHVDTVRALCAGAHVAVLTPARAKLRSLPGLLHGQPLTLGYYRDASLQRWVACTAARERLDAAVVFSSSMAPYATALPGVPMLVDFVDVDSAKWTAYAGARRWPLSWLYRREGRRLLAYERHVAAAAQRSFFVSDAECALFASAAPECASRIETLGNGVDAVHFTPDALRPSPYAADELPLVFTGAMDYWPNVDAVTWFAQAVLPRLRERWPRLRFHIVGRAPTPAVRALASAAVAVSGTVPDVRPYLQHAAVVVAPLRVARGVQNKVLEAMAMARPVVVAAACARVLDAVAGTELLSAESADDFVQQIDALLQAPDQARRIGAAARERVLQSFSWAAHLSRIDRSLNALPAFNRPPFGGLTAAVQP